MKKFYFIFYLFIEYNTKLNNLKNVFKGYFCNFYLFSNNLFSLIFKIKFSILFISIEYK